MSSQSFPRWGDGRRLDSRHSTNSDGTVLLFTLPGLPVWSFRIVLIGQNVILEAFNGDQTLSMILDPLGSRIRSAYTLIASPQCARVMRYVDAG